MTLLAMKTLQRLATACLLAATLFALGGCSSIKVVETWNNPAPVTKRYQKLLIVGIAHDENLRTLAEDILVDELGRGGVRAVASHTLVKDIDNARRDDIVAAVRSVNADAVLSIRGVTKGDSVVSQGGEYAGIYGTATNIGGSPLPATKSYLRATLQANLYDTATANLLWTATIKTYDAEQVAKVSRDLAKFFLENLRQGGFL